MQSPVSSNPLIALIEFCTAFCLTIISIFMRSILPIRDDILWGLQCTAALGAILLAIKGMLDWFGIKNYKALKDRLKRKK